eukprot:gnl/Chilomastix_cuspidata/1427.p1 GENE.gnl/Chilomastix_cuspidata/1427~~gnl/Chilomastix_cuspidata/1427.p1  ORF type:complete len:973 (+),score=293.80 gnl/Chilomastix_cuspidata/1427:221-2920(+)
MFDGSSLHSSDPLLDSNEVTPDAYNRLAWWIASIVAIVVVLVGVVCAVFFSIQANTDYVLPSLSVVISDDWQPWAPLTKFVHAQEDGSMSVAYVDGPALLVATVPEDASDSSASEASQAEVELPEAFELLDFWESPETFGYFLVLAEDSSSGETSYFVKNRAEPSSLSPAELVPPFGTTVEDAVLVFCSESTDSACVVVSTGAELYWQTAAGAASGSDAWTLLLSGTDTQCLGSPKCHLPDSSPTAASAVDRAVGSASALWGVPCFSASASADFVLFLESDYSGVEHFVVDFYEPLDVSQHTQTANFTFSKSGTPKKSARLGLTSLGGAGAAVWVDPASSGDGDWQYLTALTVDTFYAPEAGESQVKGRFFAKWLDSTQQREKLDECVVVSSLDKADVSVSCSTLRTQTAGPVGWVPRASTNVVPLFPTSRFDGLSDAAAAALASLAGYAALDLAIYADPSIDTTHLQLVPSADSADAPLMLTRDDGWSVASVVGIGQAADVIITTTRAGPHNRRIEKISLIDAASQAPLVPTPLSSSDSDGYYEASLSPLGEALIVGYLGPNAPFQRVVSSALEMAPFAQNSLLLISENARLQELTAAYDSPSVSVTTVQGATSTSGYNLVACNTDANGFSNYCRQSLGPGEAPALFARILYPPGFDANRDRAYPALVVSGAGLDTQSALNSYPAHDWSWYAASAGVVVVFVDPAGSGMRGRLFANQVYGQAGTLERLDVLAVIQWASEQGWCSGDIGVAGTGFGAFTALAAAVEDSREHSPPLLSCAVAVSPVADWALMSSAVSERFMGTPAANPFWYDTSSLVTQLGGLSPDVSALLVHGTGDLTVNFQHSVLLVDAAITAGLPFESFYYPNAGEELAAAPPAHLQRTIIRHVARAVPDAGLSASD